jgi:enoyl-CoA hydratase/carnithine racemase
MTYKHIKVKQSPCKQIWEVTLNQPKKMNAVDFSTLKEIETFMNEHVNPLSSEARAVVFYGEGKHFTSGLDLMAAAEIG